MQLKPSKLIALFIAFVFPLVCLCQPSITDSTEVVWYENFTGCYNVPTSGFNATYEYGEFPPVVEFNETAKGKKPELSIGIHASFNVKIDLLGAYGKFTLTFNSLNPKNVSVVFNNKSFTNKDKSKYTFNVVKGTKNITLRFERATERGNAIIDNLKLVVDKSCRQGTQRPNISFNDTSCTVINGVESSFPILNNPNNQEVHYWSTDRSVAEIDEHTGQIDIKDVGQARIYAVCYGENNYRSQVVSYRLYVKRKKEEGELFYESFNNVYGKGGYDKDFHQTTAMAERKYFDHPNDICEELNTAYKCILINPNGFYAFKIPSSYNGNKCVLSFKAAQSSYSDSQNTITVKYTKNNQYWNRKIKVKKEEWNTFYVEFNELTPGSNIYISGKNIYLDDVLFIDKSNIRDVNITISKYGYATLYYSDRSLIIPNGMTAYTIKFKDNNVVPSKIYKVGDIIPKGEAVLLKASPGMYSMAISTQTPALDSANILTGSDSSTLTTGGTEYYLFGVDPDEDGAVGFYWGAENGSAFTNAAHKSYIAIKGSASTRSGKLVLLP